MKCDFGNVVGPAILTPLIILTKSAHFFINFWQIEIMKSWRISKFPIGKYLNLAIRPLFLFQSRFRPVFSWTILVPNLETIPLRGLGKSEIHSDHYFSRFFKFFTNIQIFVFLTFLRISEIIAWFLMKVTWKQQFRTSQKSLRTFSGFFEACFFDQISWFSINRSRIPGFRCFRSSFEDWPLRIHMHKSEILNFCEFFRFFNFLISC